MLVGHHEGSLMRNSTHTQFDVEKVATAKCAPISIYIVNDVYHAAITVEKTVRVCRMYNQNCCYELAGDYVVFSFVGV